MSLFDRFFRPPPDPDEEEHEVDIVEKIRSWDGEPILLWSWEDVAETYGVSPHYHVKLVGPVLPWVGSRAAVEIFYLVQPTREAAIEKAFERVHEICVKDGLNWDPDEWHVVTLIPRNCN